MQEVRPLAIYAPNSHNDVVIVLTVVGYDYS